MKDVELRPLLEKDKSEYAELLLIYLNFKFNKYSIEDVRRTQT